MAKTRRKHTGRDDPTAESAAVGSTMVVPEGYAELLVDIKQRIATARVKAALAVNRELIELYWDIGRLIVERQQREGWGKGIIDQLGHDIQTAFPGIEGFSARNLWRMRSFYLAYCKQLTILPQAAAEIPWFHNVVLIEKVKDLAERLWYAQKTIEHGWSLAARGNQSEFAQPRGIRGPADDLRRRLAAREAYEACQSQDETKTHDRSLTEPRPARDAHAESSPQLTTDH